MRGLAPETSHPWRGSRRHCRPRLNQAPAATGGVGAAGTLLGRQLSRGPASFLDAELSRGGVLLWVRTPDAEAERRAVEILRRHAIRVHGHETAA